VRPATITVLFFMLVVAAEAHAQPAATPNAATPAAPYPPPGAYPPPGPYPPPGAYPPPGQYPPPYAPYPYQASPNGPNPQALYLYESESKSPALALVLEIVIPGIGSIYADHTVGALVTWGLALTGMSLALWDLNRHEQGNLFYTGLLIASGGRIYGFVDSLSSASDYNRALAQRLGLPPTIALTPAAIRMGDRVAWGPALTLRF
jgi:hypothetical protein